MSAAENDSKSTITLKGSTDIVSEFFGYSINSILYQRGTSHTMLEYLCENLHP